jgi:hypothetical protein
MRWGLDRKDIEKKPQSLFKKKISNNKIVKENKLKKKDVNSC